jgi:hypothetical protein
MFDNGRHSPFEESVAKKDTRSDLERFSEILIATLKDLHSINKELKYMSWLKMIELKSKGMYTDEQMIKDFKDFELDGI